MTSALAPPEAGGPVASPLSAPVASAAPAPDGEALAKAEAEGEAEGLRGFPSREEEHLYLQLQRFSFCLDRFAARRADAPPSPETGGEHPVARIGREIEVLDAYVAER